MKKPLSIILSVMLIFCISACTETDLKNNSSSTIAVYEEQAYRAEAGEQNTTAETLPELTKEPELPALTDEDIVVKEKIAKEISTNIDFRKNKYEVIDGKNYNIYFSGVEELFGKKSLITYTNNVGDRFVYKSENGRLFVVELHSVKVDSDIKKTNSESARKIAENFISQFYDISKLTLSTEKDVENRYLFVYSKYISGFKTDADFEITVDYSGNITYFRDNVDLFDKFNINIDENLINTKIDECFSEYSEDKVIFDEDSVIITVKDNQPVLMLQVRKDGAVSVRYIPLEYESEE